MKKEALAMGSVRVAIVGVGNCASSLVQGVEYYRDADPNERVPGHMHGTFGEYHVADVQFVAAFDVDAKKVGRDLAEAIVASQNNTIKICDVPPTGVTVQRGPTLDRLISKKISKTQSVTSQIPHEMEKANIHIGPSDHVPWLLDRKWAHIRLEG